MCKKPKKDIVIGKITLPYVPSKGVWMLPGGFGESREHFAIEYAKRLNSIAKKEASTC
jgi:hypothetical protein